MVEASAKLCCPQCGSDSLIKDGQRYFPNDESVKHGSASALTSMIGESELKNGNLWKQCG